MARPVAVRSRPSPRGRRTATRRSIPRRLPFGHGARHCIGFALAEMELILVVARIAQRVDLDLTSRAVPLPYGMVVNRPSGGVRATARLRPHVVKCFASGGASEATSPSRQLLIEALKTSYRE